LLKTYAKPTGRVVMPSWIDHILESLE